GAPFPRCHDNAFMSCMLCAGWQTLHQNTAVVYKERREYQAQDGRQLDQDIQRGTGGILERIANGITDDSGFMTIGSLAAMVAFFNIFLGVIPRAAAVRRRNGKCSTRYQ